MDKQGLTLGDGLIHADVQGKDNKPFDVFFQFDEDKPIQLCSGIRTKFVMEITADGVVEFYTPADYNEQTQLAGVRDKRKKFKIFTKRKS